MIEPGHPRLSIVRQCELASISRSSFYREPTAESEETLRLIRVIDEQFLETVINGRKGTQMPAFGERLSPDEVWQVHAFVKSTDHY